MKKRLFEKTKKPRRTAFEVFALGFGIKQLFEEIKIKETIKSRSQDFQTSAAITTLLKAAPI